MEVSSSPFRTFRTVWCVEWKRFRFGENAQVVSEQHECIQYKQTQVHENPHHKKAVLPLLLLSLLPASIVVVVVEPPRTNEKAQKQKKKGEMRFVLKNNY